MKKRKSSREVTLKEAVRATASQDFGSWPTGRDRRRLDEGEQPREVRAPTKLLTPELDMEKAIIA